MHYTGKKASWYKQKNEVKYIEAQGANEGQYTWNQDEDFLAQLAEDLSPKHLFAQ